MASWSPSTLGSIFGMDAAGDCVMVSGVLCDTHAHLDFPDFRDDLDALIRRAVEAGVTRILTIGTSLESSRRAVAVAGRYPEVFAVVGVHPCHVAEAPDDVRTELSELVRQRKVVGVGETGLDYHHLPKDNEPEALRLRHRQAALFRQHLEVAAEAGLNLVIHQRESFRDTLRVLEAFGPGPRSVFHCFSGTAAEAGEVVARGWLVSFTGILTFKSAVNVRDALAAVPADSFMLETDCPYLAPVPHRGKRCEPAHVLETARVAAGVRGWELEEVGRRTSATARAFFRGLE